MKISRHILFAWIALLAMFSIAITASMAQAQQSAYVASPNISGFDVEPVASLSAGNSLLFTLYGSAGGTATLQINGTVGRFPLQEVEAGVYEGTYVIKVRDRISADSVVTANLREGNRIATEVLDESLQAGVPSRSASKRNAEAAALAATPRISSFDVDPVAALDPGAELMFFVNGNRGGTASVRIDGVKGKVALPEVSPGAYEGTYVIKDRDRIRSNSPVTATLRLGDREVSGLLAKSMLAVAGQVPSSRRQARGCATCGVVESINVVEVNGNGSYLGKIAGGVVGAVLGSQVGAGRGTTVAEIAGAVGGAMAGNEIEKRVNKSKHYDVTVRLQGGGVQTVSYSTEPAFKVGDRIKVENDLLVARP